MLTYKKWIIIAIAVVIVAVISFYAISIYNFGKGIQEENNDPQVEQNNPIDESEDEPDPPPEWEGAERVNILLLGIDSRGNEPARSDTMMVLSIDPVTKRAHLFSVMRDTYVNIPGRGMERVNAAYAFGGAAKAMETISELIDLPIHFYVSVDFEGFIALVDAIGGIEFEVEKNMRHFDPTDDPAYNIDLKKGLQMLDGNKALQYVRFRNDTLADFTRTERQRNLMKAVADKMLTFSSLVRLPFTLEKIEPYIQTNLSLRQMWALGNLGAGLKSENIITDQLPPTSLLREETLSNGAEVITVNTERLQKYVADKLAEGIADDAEDGAGANAGVPGAGGDSAGGTREP